MRRLLPANQFGFLANCDSRTAKNDQAENNKIIIQCDKRQDTVAGRHFSHTTSPSSKVRSVAAPQPQPQPHGCQMGSTWRTCAWWHYRRNYDRRTTVIRRANWDQTSGTDRDKETQSERGQHFANLCGCACIWIFIKLIAMHFKHLLMYTHTIL